MYSGCGYCLNLRSEQETITRAPWTMQRLKPQPALCVATYLGHGAIKKQPVAPKTTMKHVFLGSLGVKNTGFDGFRGLQEHRKQARGARRAERLRNPNDRTRPEQKRVGNLGKS